MWASNRDAYVFHIMHINKLFQVVSGRRYLFMQWIYSFKVVVVNDFFFRCHLSVQVMCKIRSSSWLVSSEIVRYKSKLSNQKNVIDVHIA